MREFTISESPTGGWVIIDPITTSVLGSYATTASLLDGLLDIIASSSPSSGGDIVMQEGEV